MRLSRRELQLGISTSYVFRKYLNIFCHVVLAKQNITQVSYFHACFVGVIIFRNFEKKNLKSVKKVGLRATMKSQEIFKSLLFSNLMRA